MTIYAKEHFDRMSAVDHACLDLRALTRASLKTNVRLADAWGVSPADIRAAVRDRDAGGLAHLVVRAEYGDRVYRRARRLIMGRWILV